MNENCVVVSRMLENHSRGSVAPSAMRFDHPVFCYISSELIDVVMYQEARKGESKTEAVRRV
jgi:hypothetical protein